MIEPTADDVAQSLWNVYLNIVADASNAGIVESAYIDYGISLDQAGIKPTLAGYAYCCIRCDGIADRLVTTRHGVDKLCSRCAIVVLEDVQCRGPQAGGATTG